MTEGPNGRWFPIALLTTAVAATGVWLDVQYDWITPAFDAVAHLFYEVPLVAAVRRPSQLALVRWHLAIGSVLAVIGVLLIPKLTPYNRALLVIMGIGYWVRAAVWICGGNLPLVPGDSCHYLEVATSVLSGEGPVKHYVESFFTDYPRIREGQGVLDDWATPLDAYARATAFWIAGLGQESSIETRLVAAKACSFITNLLALPALYILARRCYSPRVALWSMAVLAILPVHAIYAGFVLRESLVALMSILAVWTLCEVFRAEPHGRPIWAWAAAAGLCGGLAVLSRTTAIALLAAAGLFALVAHGRRRFGPILLWAAIAGLICVPWAWMTLKEYGSPFYSYTSFFEYNFSWTIHHYDKGNTFTSQFYTLANLPEIVRIKVKSLLLIVVYSTMIVGLPLALGFCRSLGRGGGQGRETDRLVAAILVVFVLATLKSIADVTQVAQLGRYYLPVFALSLPAGVAGLLEWIDSSDRHTRILPLVAVTYCALVWSDPTWAYDATWLVKRYQLHWPGLQEAGEWVQAHPERVPRDARVMTWFPWELRVTSDRTTILMPRNYDPRRIKSVMGQYGVTHFLWGSFEPPPYYEINPERWALELEQLRTAIRLTDAREIYRTSRERFFPLRLYRVQ